MSRLFQTLALLFIVVASSYSQVDFTAVEKDLAYHADIMVNVTVEDHRFKAADLFREQFEVMLNTPYNIMPATSDSSSTDYILMGYRQIAKFDKVKVLEVLSVNDGEITFGKELFLKEVEGSRDEVRTRLLMTYTRADSIT